MVKTHVLQEVHVERTQRRAASSAISTRGGVVRVLPGMQAAFVDIGLERAAFIHAAEISTAKAAPWKASVPWSMRGQALVVQVTKDPIGTKGARLTTHLSIPSRYLVHAAHQPCRDILADRGRSRARAPEEGGGRLRGGGRHRGQGGFILRTAAEGAGEDEIPADIRYLRWPWDQIAAQIQTVGAPSVIYEDLSLAIRTLRDLVNLRIEKIRIISARELPEDHFLRRRIDAGDFRSPRTLPGERPIFDLYGVEDEIQKALERKVLLKSGGYLIVDPTEAMTTIDVNTGACRISHRGNLIFKTNLEAATAIARLRLRNLGGIIIIDFIDMEDEEHRRQVLRTLEKLNWSATTRRPTSSASPRLGLVQMTCKRTRESPVQILCEPCPCCQGRGMLKTAETTCYEIFREILREARAYQADSTWCWPTRRWWTGCSTRSRVTSPISRRSSAAPSSSRSRRCTRRSNMTWSCSEAYG